MINPEEKRKYRRVNFREPIQFWENELVHAWGTLSCDLSEGGLRVYMNDFVPLDTKFVLSLPKGSEQYLEFPAKVVWIKQLPNSERYEAGLEFENEQIFTQLRKNLHALVHEQ